MLGRRWFISCQDQGTGLGNAAIMAVGNPDQKTLWGKRWAAMAIAEPAAGSDSKNISTTAVLMEMNGF